MADARQFGTGDDGNDDDDNDNDYDDDDNDNDDAENEVRAGLVVVKSAHDWLSSVLFFFFDTN